MRLKSGLHRCNDVVEELARKVEALLVESMSESVKAVSPKTLVKIFDYHTAESLTSEQVYRARHLLCTRLFREKDHQRMLKSLQSRIHDIATTINAKVEDHGIKYTVNKNSCIKTRWRGFLRGVDKMVIWLWHVNFQMQIAGKSSASFAVCSAVSLLDASTPLGQSFKCPSLSVTERGHSHVSRASIPSDATATRMTTAISDPATHAPTLSNKDSVLTELARDNQEPQRVACPASADQTSLSCTDDDLLESGRSSAHSFRLDPHRARSLPRPNVRPPVRTPRAGHARISPRKGRRTNPQRRSRPKAESSTVFQGLSLLDTEETGCKDPYYYPEPNPYTEDLPDAKFYKGADLSRIEWRENSEAYTRACMKEFLSDMSTRHELGDLDIYPNSERRIWM